MIPISVYKKMVPSIYEHYSVESEIQRLLDDTLEKRYIEKHHMSGDILKYFQRNFFSILFLSIYRSLNIPKKRRLFYGVLNHCLRGIVTGTDNLLDDEYKGMLPLRFPDDATRFKSVMHILLFDRFMFRAVESAAASGIIARDDVNALHKAIFSAIVPIGAEEAGEEGGVGSIITPEEILSSVHMYKGGKLLCLSFVAPLFIEKGLTDVIKMADAGVYSIGMALQVIDDITDIYDDIRDRRHNYLVSSIYHKGAQGEKALLKEMLASDTLDRPQVEEAYRESVTRVMEEAIGEALWGFDLLHHAGYCFSRKAAMSLIRNIFHLRGAGGLLELLPDEEKITLTLGDHNRDAIYPGGESESHGMAV